MTSDILFYLIKFQQIGPAFSFVGPVVLPDLLTLASFVRATRFAAFVCTCHACGTTAVELVIARLSIWTWLYSTLSLLCSRPPWTVARYLSTICGGLHHLATKKILWALFIHQ